MYSRERETESVGPQWTRRGRSTARSGLFGLLEVAQEPERVQLLRDTPSHGHRYAQPGVYEPTDVPEEHQDQES